MAAIEALAVADRIGLNASAIVSKSAGGAMTVNRTEEPTPESTLGATAIGVLIGILAAGVGLAIGATAGLVVGGIADTFCLEVERGFLADVERTLAPGKTALVAQIDEEDEEAVNTRIAEIGVVVFRQPVGDVADGQDAAATARFGRLFDRAK